MEVILLGGQSPRHYDWVREVREALEFAGLPVVLHDYAHWQNGEHEINAEAELAALTALAAEQDDYIIVAKSIGCVLTSIGIVRGVLKPQACVFLGLPLAATKMHDEAMAGMALLPPTIFAQNETDPLGSYEAIKAFTRQLVPPTSIFVALPGSSHDYTDFELIAELTSRLAKSLKAS